MLGRLPDGRNPSHRCCEMEFRHPVATFVGFTMNRVLKKKAMNKGPSLILSLWCSWDRISLSDSLPTAFYSLHFSPSLLSISLSLISLSWRGPRSPGGLGLDRPPPAFPSPSLPSSLSSSLLFSLLYFCWRFELNAQTSLVGHRYGSACPEPLGSACLEPSCSGSFGTP